MPDGVAASTTPIGEWDFVQKYFKMLKVGLPRPVVEHKMLSEVRYLGIGLLDSVRRIRSRYCQCEKCGQVVVDGWAMDHESCAKSIIGKCRHRLLSNDTACK